MNEEIKIQGFGYSEMYEWQNPPEGVNNFAKFVTFSKDEPTKIVPYGKNSDDMVLGISTVNAITTSDDPDNWVKRYMVTETGDIILQKERLAVGQKEYDENLEMAFIHTFPWEHLIRVDNKEYDSSKQYVKRSARLEWVRVNLIGKAIVYDNGECNVGEWCTPYVGKIKAKWGTAIPAKETDVHKFYVLERINEKCIMILNK